MFNQLKDLHYVTPSLYNSWRWYMDSNQEKKDFLNVLNRVWVEPSDAIIKGIKFENAVAEIAKNGHTSILDEIEDSAELKCAREIAEIVKGGWFQEKLKMQLTPEIVLYGKADVIKGPKIYDIKRVANYEPGKYSQSIQHEIYMLASRIRDFDYLVCDGNNFYVESYWFPDMGDLEQQVTGKINEFIEFLKTDNDFFKSYSDNWKWSGRTF